MQAKKEAEMVQKIIEKVMMNFVSKYEMIEIKVKKKVDGEHGDMCR